MVRYGFQFDVAGNHQLEGLKGTMGLHSHIEIIPQIIFWEMQTSRNEMVKLSAVLVSKKGNLVFINVHGHWFAVHIHCICMHFPYSRVIGRTY